MNTDTDAVSVDAFRESLTVEKVRTLQIIHGAMIMGVAMFLGLTLFVRLSKGGIDLTQVEVNPFVLITLGLTLGASVLVVVLPKILCRGKEPPEANACLNLLQTVHMVRMAVAEAPGLVGVLMLFIDKGWLNVIGLVPLILLTLQAFPTRERLVAQFCDLIKRDHRLSMDELR